MSSTDIPRAVDDKSLAFVDLKSTVYGEKDVRILVMYVFYAV